MNVLITHFSFSQISFCVGLAGKLQQILEENISVLFFVWNLTGRKTSCFIKAYLPPAESFSLFEFVYIELCGPYAASVSHHVDNM